MNKKIILSYLFLLIVYISVLNPMQMSNLQNLNYNYLDKSSDYVILGPVNENFQLTNNKISVNKNISYYNEEILVHASWNLTGVDDSSLIHILFLKENVSELEYMNHNDTYYLHSIDYPINFSSSSGSLDVPINSSILFCEDIVPGKIYINLYHIYSPYESDDYTFLDCCSIYLSNPIPTIADMPINPISIYQHTTYSFKSRISASDDDELVYDNEILSVNLYYEDSVIFNQQYSISPDGQFEIVIGGLNFVDFGCYVLNIILDETSNFSNATFSIQLYVYTYLIFELANNIKTDIELDIGSFIFQGFFKDYDGQIIPINASDLVIESDLAISKIAVIDHNFYIEFEYPEFVGKYTVKLSLTSSEYKISDMTKEFTLRFYTSQPLYVYLLIFITVIGVSIQFGKMKPKKHRNGEINSRIDKHIEKLDAKFTEWDNNDKLGISKKTFISKI